MQGIASSIESHDVSHDQQKEQMPLKIKTEEGTSFEGYDEHFDSQEPLMSSRAIKSEVPKMKTAKIVLRKLHLRRTISKCADCHKVLQGSSIQYSLDGMVNRRILKCNRCKNNKHSEAGHQTRHAKEDIPGVKTNHPRHGATDTMENADQPGENTASVERAILSSNQGEMTENLAFQKEMADSTSTKTQSRIHRDELKVDHIETRSNKSGKGDGRPYKCGMCSETFCDKIQLQRHTTKQTCVKQQARQVCSTKDDQRRDLDGQLVRHADERPFSCNVCLKAFIHKYSLNRHMKTHTGKRPFGCRICNKAYNQKYKVTLHMRTHNGERPFSCSICSKAFTYRSVLTKHQRVHTNERPFSCSICSKAFAYKNILTKHQITHTNERPFSCSICSKAFTFKSAVTRHLRTHSSDRPFSCRICGKAFSQTGGLKRHLRTHTGERPFSCSICNKAFYQGSHLKTHMTIHTGKK